MVERYRVVAPGDYGAEGHPEGEYVEYEDYASLSSQHAEAVARVEALEEALAATFRRHFEGNDVERFERAAEEFRRVTGMLAPGKDAPAAGGNTPSREERQRAWDEWCDRRWRESVERLRTLLAQRAARDPRIPEYEREMREGDGPEPPASRDARGEACLHGGNAATCPKCWAEGKGMDASRDAAQAKEAGRG